MGICAAKEPAPKSNNNGKPSFSATDDKDFREILKNVTLLVLQRLVTCLEYEKHGFTEVAQTRNLSNILELMKPSAWTGILICFCIIANYGRCRFTK